MNLNHQPDDYSSDGDYQVKPTKTMKGTVIKLSPEAVEWAKVIKGIKGFSSLTETVEWLVKDKMKLIENELNSINNKFKK